MDSDEKLRKIDSVMTRKVVAFRKDSPVIDVVKRMVKDQISCVVVSADKKPVGILTERDIIDRIILKKKRPEDVVMKDIMTHPVVTVKADDEIVPVGEMMKNKRVRRFPVVDDKGLMIGLVTETDVLEGFIRLAKHLDWLLIKTKISVEEYINKLKQARLL